MNDYNARIGSALSRESELKWFFLVPFSGQQVIVCAHRYVKNETDQRWGHGQCFTLTQDLKHSATWDPCEGRLKQKYVYTHQRP